MKPLRFFIFSNLLNIIVALYLFSQFNIASDALLYVLAHFFLASVANTILVKKVIKNNICLISSPVTCFLIITQVYLTFSSLKYFADNSTFYPMFELTKADQFIGSLLGFGVIFVILFSLERSFFVSPTKFIEWVKKHSKLILTTSMVFLLVSVVIKVFLFTQGYGSTYSNSLFTKLELRDRNDAIYLNVNEIFDQLVIIYFFLLYKIFKFSSFNRFLRFPFLFITIVFFIYNLFFFKSRLLILFLVLTVISVVQAFQPRKGAMYLALLFLLLPVTVGILPILNWLLVRDNLMADSSEFLIQLTSYRADITDYAYAILKKSNFIGVNPDIFFQGLLNAIPNVIFPGKDLLVKDAYSIGLDKIGWKAKSDTSFEIIDYQDSLFSAGSMAFGIIGFVFIPLVYVRILNYLAFFFTKYLKKGFVPLVIFPLITTAFRVELEFSNIFINIRNSIQMIFISLILLIFYKVFSRKS